MKNILFYSFILFNLLSIQLYSQIVENFETETALSTTFSEGGTTFTVTGDLKVEFFTALGASESDFWLGTGAFGTGTSGLAGSIILSSPAISFTITQMKVWTSNDDGSFEAAGFVTFRGTPSGGGADLVEIVYIDPVDEFTYQSLTFSGALAGAAITELEIELPALLNYIAIDDFTFTSVLAVCPTISAVTANKSAACINEPFNLSASGLIDMNMTANLETNFGIMFKAFTVTPADPYIGGNILGFVPYGSLIGGTTANLNNVGMSVNGNYEIYAILVPPPTNPTCRPSQMTTIIIYPLTPDINETYTGCSGDGHSYTSPSGTVYNEGNPSGTENLTDANGCPYTVTVAFVFNALTADINETYTGCSGDGHSYTSPSGTVYNEGNPSGTENLTDANGCPYTVTVAFVFNALTADINETYTGCSGDGHSYTSPSGTVYNETNPRGTENLTDANNCPYKVTVAFVFNALTPDINETYTGCSGDGHSYTSPSGTVYNEGNPSGTENLTDANGCPYTVTVAFVFNALTADINETYTGCSGDGHSYTSPSGTVYNETNPRGTENLTDANNCPYKVTVAFVFNALTPDINETYTGCSGDGHSYTSPSGTVYDESNPSGTENLTDANNCPYKVTVAFVFNALTADINETYTGCSGDGHSYTSPSGTVYNEGNPSGTENLTDANNCPYTVTVAFVFNALTPDINETYTGCSGDGHSYTSPSGTVYNEGNPSGTENLTDANNCPYTVTVTFVFNALTTDINETYTGCSGDGHSYTSPSGTVYDESNPSGTENLTDANGCPYTVTVAFVFNALTPDINETYTGCSGDGHSYTSPSGTVYDENNPNGTEILYDANGCPYTVNVDFIFNPLTADINETYTGCSGDGHSYSSPSGTVYNEGNPSGTENLTDANGCPYKVNVTFIFNPLTADINETHNGCEGDGHSYSSPSGTVYNEGNPNGTENLTDANGCPYTVTVAFTFNPLPEVNLHLSTECIDAVFQNNISGGTPVNGSEPGDNSFYSGSGIIDNGNGFNFSLNPQQTGLGTQLIYYTYTDNNGCSGTASDVILVLSGDNDCDGIPDEEDCNDFDPINSTDCSDGCIDEIIVDFNQFLNSGIVNQASNKITILDDLYIIGTRQYFANNEIIIQNATLNPSPMQFTELNGPGCD